MAIASSLFSSKPLLERFRSPVFIASALSLGAHGIFFAAMPILSASEDLREQEESVPVVALSAEEAQRLPDTVRGDQLNDPFAIFGDAQLTTQDGDASLPVPGSPPPFGDLSGLGNFDSSLPANTSPLWGNPVDIFQGSLPAIPGETSVIFPPSSGFDSLNNGSGALEIPAGSSTIGIAASDSTATASDTLDDVGDAPIVQTEGDNIADQTPASEDASLLDGSGEVPGSGLEAPLVAVEGGTSIEGAFSPGTEPLPEKGQEPPAPVDPDSLAQSQPANGNEGEGQPRDGSGLAAGAPPDSEAPTLDSQDPMMIAFREKQQLYKNYLNNQQGLADAAQVWSDMGDLASEQGLVLQPAQRLAIQYPDPKFQCPADAAPALFTLVNTADGSIAVPQLEQSTQYPALDAAATDVATAHAEGLTDPGVYSLEIKFQDEAGSCVASEPIS